MDWKLFLREELVCGSDIRWVLGKKNQDLPAFLNYRDLCGYINRYIGYLLLSSSIFFILLYNKTLFKHISLLISIDRSSLLSSASQSYLLSLTKHSK